MTMFEKIDSLRMAKGWSGAELTRQLGLKSRAVYSQWKQGLQKPSPENLKNMAELFGVSVFDLLDDESDKKTATISGDGYEPDTITDYDLRFLSWFHSLPQEKRKAILIAQDAPEDLL